MICKPDSALILVGHGSTLNPDSATPTQEHAETIRSQNLFAEVHTCFWKEEPSMRDVLAMTTCTDLYIVPLFISEGYFTETVIPRELQLQGRITQRDGKTLKYCDPIGNHHSMTSALLQRAKEIAPGIPESETSLIIVGHGTSLNENSAKAAKYQAQVLSETTPYAEVFNAYMEEPPLVSDWYKFTSSPHVVVVPFFIADGLHSYQDIPVMLGLESHIPPAASQREVFHHEPKLLHGKTVYFSSSIGTEPMIAQVILELVHDFDTNFLQSS